MWESKRGVSQSPSKNNKCEKKEKMRMERIGMMVADGYEEIEMLTVVDVLRRAGIVCEIISVNGRKDVKSSHQVIVQADVLYEEADFDSYQGLVIPGGLPGTTNLGAHAGVCEQ